ncbi:MAG: spore germination protein, partial [Longicatena sp.]
MNNAYQEMINGLDSQLQITKNFDVVTKALRVQGLSMNYYFVDGFAKDEILEKMTEFLLKADIKTIVEKADIQVFCDLFIPYLEVDIKKDINDMCNAVLSGSVLLIVEGYAQGIVIDARTYPTRSMSEPEDDKVLRGSRDGFVETLIFNTALIRRRIRDCRLRMEYHAIGSISKTDIVLCYMEGIADDKLVLNIRKKLD